MNHFEEQVAIFQVDKVCSWNPAADKALRQRFLQESRLWGQGGDTEPVLDHQSPRARRWPAKWLARVEHQGWSLEELGRVLSAGRKEKASAHGAV